MNISVIIPVYNAECFLEKAVLSALQFPEVKEVLMVEDKSPDRSLEICENFERIHARVKLFRHPDLGNHGAGASRNLGIEKASQEFIAFLDADDYYLPNRFDAEKEIFKNPEIDGVFGALGTEFMSDAAKDEFKRKFQNIELTTVKYAQKGKQIFYDLLGYKPGFGTFFHLNTLTVRKNCLRQNNLRFNADLRVHQDQDFITKLAYHCRLTTGEIEQAIAIRGVHDDNRITKIHHYSREYKQRQLLIWQSLYNWSAKLDILPEYKKHIARQYRSYLLAEASNFKKIIAIAKDPVLLRTRYRHLFV